MELLHSAIILGTHYLSRNCISPKNVWLCSSRVRGRKWWLHFFR